MAFDISYLGLSKKTLPEGWREDRLDSIVDFNPEQVNDDYPHSLIDYLDISNVGRGSLGKAEHLTLVNAPSRAKRIVRTNDTILSTVRPGNRAYAFLKDVPSNLIVSTGFAVLRAKGSDPRFLYYLATCDPLIDYLASIAEEKTAYPSVNPGDIAECRVPIPPISEQHAIASILGSLDDMIELNRQMNETLEAMARAIFQSWFVDFDPVRAKMDGRQPMGMDAETAALFPSEFWEVDGRKVPKGWRVIELGDIAYIIDCLHAKKPERQEAGEPYLQLNNIRDDGLLDMSDIFFITSEDYQKWISRIEAQKGDCLITNAGRVGAVSQIPEGVKSALGRNMTGIRLKNQYPYPTFLIQCLLSQQMRQEIEMRIDRGTVLDSLNVRNIPKLRLVFPTNNQEILHKFELICRPLREKMEKNLVEAHTLAKIRDTLLPKLISGEIKVKNT